MKTIRSRIQAAHDALALPPMSGATGRPPGALSWFCQQVEDRGGWRPASATVHRWVNGEVSNPRSDLAETLLGLESEARVARRLEASAHSFRR